MKFNSSLIALSIGITVAIASYASIASARVVLKGSDLIGRVSYPTNQEYTQQRSKIITFNAFSLNKKTESK